MLSPLLGSDLASKYAPTLQQALQKMQSGGYQNTKGDLLRAIKESGISKRQLQGMMGVLDMPVAQNILDKISPGLSNGLRNLGQELNVGEGAPVNPGGVNREEFPPLKKR